MSPEFRYVVVVFCMSHLVDSCMRLKYALQTSPVINYVGAMLPETLYSADDESLRHI